MRKKEIDAIDVQILRTLASNSNLLNQDLAEIVGLTPSPTLRRVENLREKGYLIAEKAEVNYEKLGFLSRTSILAQYLGAYEETIIPPLQASSRVITLIELSENKLGFDVRWLIAVVIGKDREDLNRELRTIVKRDRILQLYEYTTPYFHRINAFNFGTNDIIESK
jgi:Lrp/AsnC family leucine-responsive transcriptional regulator